MSASETPRLETEHLVIWMPEAQDAERVLGYFERNQKHLERWEPSRPATFYTEPFWVRQLEVNRDEYRSDRGLRMFLAPREHPQGQILGVANLSNIVRGVLQGCNLGYSLDGERQNEGLMTEALGAMVEYAFGPLRLHRVSADYQPENDASARVLEKLGFEKQGYAKRFLFLDGAWRDHVLTAKFLPGAEGPDKTSRMPL
jgi:[ribosomal protein S5]-alanine N-acetyltransferase